MNKYMFNTKIKKAFAKKEKKDFSEFIEKGKDTLREPCENFRQFAERIGVKSEEVKEFKYYWINR